MNLEFTDNGNCPPGFIDEGTKVKGGGTRRPVDPDKEWRRSMSAWPGTLAEAEAQMNIIRQNPKALDYENTIRNNSSVEHDPGDLGF